MSTDRWRAALVLVALLAAAITGPAPVVAADIPSWRDGTAPAIVDVLPANGAIAGGDVELQAVLVADAPITSPTLHVDGDAVAARVERGDGQVTLRAELTLAPGAHRARAAMVVDGRASSRTWRFTVSALQPRRLAGPDRTATAAAVARELAAGQPASAAVLARADDGADALSGVGLADALGGPLLLTSSDHLPDATASALRDAVADGGAVVVLGGTAAVSDAVVDDVRALGFRVRRIAGATRIETSVAIASEVAAVRGGEPVERVVVASGRDFPDALAVSSPAAVRSWPVLLTEPDALPAPVRAHLAAVDPTQIEVVGGPAAVEPDVALALADVAPVRRTGGADRYATAGLIADRFGGSSDDVALASGETFADALAGAVLAARDDVPVLLTGPRLPAATAARLAGRGGEMTVLGGIAAVPDTAVTAALSASAGGVAVEVHPPPGTVHLDDDGRDLQPVRLRIPGARLLPESMASGWVDGREARVHWDLDEDAFHVTVAELPTPLPVDGHVDLRLRAVLRTVDGRIGHVDEVLRVRQRAPRTTTPEGYLALGGRGDVVGRGGTLHRYSLEVEPATGVDLDVFAEEAEAALSDPRGWTARNQVRLQRVPPAEARIRVLLARPATVDRLCAQAGLRTGGIYSCWNGRFAALNLTRWRTGARGFDAPLAAYRAYLVNHEVGHGLGHGHRGCPAAGALAPVMMQQTKGTAPCLPSSWPYP